MVYTKTSNPGNPGMRCRAPGLVDLTQGLRRVNPGVNRVSPLNSGLYGERGAVVKNRRVRSVIEVIAGNGIRLGMWISLISAAVAVSSAQAPVGVPRDLARERAQRIVDVRYELEYTLVAKADSTAGEEEIKFRYKPQQLLSNGPLRPTEPGPLLLDFREGTISKLEVNGKELPVKMENGHIEIPEELLRITKKTESQGQAEARQSTTATDNLGRPVGAKPGARIPDSTEDKIIKISLTEPIAASGKALSRY
jgi:hypothetical protein